MAHGAEEFPLKICLLGPRNAGKSAIALQVLLKWGGLGPHTTQMLQAQMEERNLTYAQRLAFLQRNPEQPLLRHYQSPKYEVNIFSTLSHHFCLPESEASCVVLLVVSAARGEFEASRKLLRKQVSFAGKLRVQHLVVCVNKMDAADLPYSRLRYDSIVGMISVNLWAVRRDPGNVVFLPISATWGDNMQDASWEMPWFEGWVMKEEAGGTLRGKTLRQLLDAMAFNRRLASACRVGAWSPEEEWSLLWEWKALASPASCVPACSHALSAALLRSGIWRSPEQCRSRANFLLRGHITGRLQRRQRPGGPFSEDLQAILDGEAARCVLHVGRRKPGSPASPPLEKEEPAATAGPSVLRELLLAGEGLRTEKGPGARLERSPEGREDLPAQLRCLRLPSGQRGQDPDCLLTGLEMKPCERIAWPTRGQAEPGVEKVAFSKGYWCVVRRAAYFALKQKPAEAVVGPQPRQGVPRHPLEGATSPLPRTPRPPLLPTPEACQLIAYPLPPASLFPAHWRPPALLQPPLALAEPLLLLDSPVRAFPVAQPVAPLVPLQLTPLSIFCATPEPANALPWRHQQAPVEPVGHWSSPHSSDTPPLGDRPTPTQPDPTPAAAAAAAGSAAVLLTPEAPEAGPLAAPPASPSEPEGPCEPSPAAEPPNSPSSGASSMSPRLPEAPAESCLGLSAETLLSSLAQLDTGEDFQVAHPPGTPPRPLSPTLSADSGAPPSPQPLGLLSCSGLLSPPWPEFRPSDS